MALVLTCVGDAGPLAYKRSRRGHAVIDALCRAFLAGRARARGDRFLPLWLRRATNCCSPGFNLPVGCLMRARHGQFPEYHTSADNLQFVQPAALATSLAVCATVLATLDGNSRYRNLLPSRSWANAACIGPLVASSMPARGRWPCCGCSITPMVSTPCWTSLSAPTCRSSSCASRGCSAGACALG